MTEKEFRHLSRAELIDLIHQLQEGTDGISADLVLTEKKRLQTRKRFKRTLRSTLAVLIVVAAISILIAVLWLPVLQIYGSSMTPTFENGEIVVLNKTSDFHTGDIIAFYYNNKILVKRVIGGSGDWINIDADGNVFVNDALLEESYLEEKSLGESDLEFPYQVPDEAYFVMGDHRNVSIDSRSSVLGCVRQEQIVGKVFLRIWPVDKIDTKF